MCTLRTLRIRCTVSVYTHSPHLGGLLRLLPALSSSFLRSLALGALVALVARCSSTPFVSRSSAVMRIICVWPTPIQPSRAELSNRTRTRSFRPPLRCLTFAFVPLMLLIIRACAIKGFENKGLQGLSLFLL